MEQKKTILTYAGLKKLEDELHDLKVNKRREIAGKIKEAREQSALLLKQSTLRQNICAASDFSTGCLVF